MVGNSAIISMMITIGMAAAAVMVPFLVIFLVARKKETGSWGSLGLGVLAYFWAHYLLPIPIIYIISIFIDLKKISDKYYIVYVLITSLIMAVMAGFGRLWCVWLMNKRTPSLYRAICSGVGFAAVQALSVIITYAGYVKDAKVLNSGGRDALTSFLSGGDSTTKTATQFDTSMINELISKLTGTSSFDIIMTGINVILVTIVEIGIIVLMYEGFIRHRKWLITAICSGINFVFTFVAIVLSSLSDEIMGSVLSKSACSIVYNAYVLICALVALWFTWGAIKRYKRVLAEGTYAHYAYFEKKSEKDKIKDLL